uniref:Uncharacterized protein n=1 Tax=Strongyloides stercoralis TaxID=6248 RepID=A0A0K0ED77_STRER
MYKNLKIKIDKFIIKTKQNYRMRELKFLRQNHQRSTNGLHIKLKTYKPLATVYEIDNIEEISKNNLYTQKNIIQSMEDKVDNEQKLLDRYNNNNNNNNKIQKIFNNIFGTSVVCDLIIADITF